VASLEARPGWLVIHGGDSTLDTPEPAFIGRRQQHQWCRVEARVDPGSAREAGVTVLMDETAHYEVVVSSGEILARTRVGPLDTVVGRAPCPTTPVVLTVATEPHIHGPDTVTFGYEDEAGVPHRVAHVDGRYLSTEVTGGFLGRTIGMFAVGGDAAFDWFDYREA
jgi:beta-xylosidase